MNAERPKVLLVDDEEVFRMSTAALLNRDGYRCDSAKDSEEASRLLPNSYDVLIADIRMPGNTQMEFLLDVHQRYPDLSVLVVTGYPSLETVLVSLHLSHVDYLLKPIEWPAMLQAILHAVEKRRRLLALRTGLDEATSMEGAVMVPDAVVNRDGLDWSLKNYFVQSASRMNVLSASLEQTLTGIMTGSVPVPTDVCEFMRCPRQTAYKQALVDTVEVLERTKHAFKSKDLGELRRRLETFLKESAG